MKNNSKNVDNSKELNIPQMIQFNEDSISIYIRYFVKCNDYTDLITYLMQIMNQFVEKKKAPKLGTFVKLIIDFDSINMSSSILSLLKLSLII